MKNQIRIGDIQPGAGYTVPPHRGETSIATLALCVICLTSLLSVAAFFLALIALAR